MKANELMIGDWYTIDVDGEPYYFQVHEKTFSLSKEDLDLHQPIPLTAEILEMNDIKPRKDADDLFVIYVSENNDIFLTEDYDVHDKDYYWGLSISNRHHDVNLISIHYVHELQHALQLCGIDKEIVMYTTCSEKHSKCDK